MLQVLKPWGGAAYSVAGDEFEGMETLDDSWAVVIERAVTDVAPRFILTR